MPMTDIDRKEMLDLVTLAVMAGINATGLSAQAKALEVISSEHENRIKAHDHTLNEHESRLRTHATALYGDPCVVDKTGLIGSVLYVSNSLAQVSQSLSKGTGLKDRIVDYLVFLAIASVIALIMKNGITLP